MNLDFTNNFSPQSRNGVKTELATTELFRTNHPSRQGLLMRTRPLPEAIGEPKKRYDTQGKGKRDRFSPIGGWFSGVVTLSVTFTALFCNFVCLFTTYTYTYTYTSPSFRGRGGLERGRGK